MAKPGRILVGAGTNGAGKSTIVGEFLTRAGAAYYNPDVRTRELVAAGLSAEANAQSWSEGFDRLRYAIDHHEVYAFETTLGGRSICRELHRAAAEGLEVYIWYVGLAYPELHIERVRARVARGGHDIPEAKIRERYPRSLSNLVDLLAVATRIDVYDNSEEGADGNPCARRVMRMKSGRIIDPDLGDLLSTAPRWAEPVVAAAVHLHEAAPRKARSSRARRAAKSSRSPHTSRRS